jgi:hypothetical protein
MSDALLLIAGELERVRRAYVPNVSASSALPRWPPATPQAIRRRDGATEFFDRLIEAAGVAA